jgi:hypothetical protein
MILCESLDPQETYIYLERYVNDGSPSGFTEKYNTSIETNPLGPISSFELCSIKVPDEINCIDFGMQPGFLSTRQILIHPDMVNSELLCECSKQRDSGFIVFPTSSSRTVKILGSEGWFIKLNYDGFIGRIDRQLGISQASAAVEVSERISEQFGRGGLSSKFSFMRETFARVADLKTSTRTYEWGMVAREPAPYPTNNSLKYIFPAFSLFSQDRKNPRDPTLLEQLFAHQSKSPRLFLLEGLLFPILESYFSLLLTCGLQLECHAQNTLIGLDDDFQIITVVERDAESIDRDLSLMSDLGLDVMQPRSEYKCLRRGQYNYEIMHSFMYDFKLGAYLLDPLIDVACKTQKLDKGLVCSEIKSFARNFISKLPTDFFPEDGMWYSYESVVHDRSQRRNYIATPNPLYR